MEFTITRSSQNLFRSGEVKIRECKFPRFFRSPTRQSTKNTKISLVEMLSSTRAWRQDRVERCFFTIDTQLLFL